MRGVLGALSGEWGTRGSGDAGRCGIGFIPGLLARTPGTGAARGSGAWVCADPQILENNPLISATGLTTISSPSPIFMPLLRVPQVPRVAAVRPIRAAQKSPVLTYSCFHPAIAVGARFQEFAAVAAAVIVARPFRQPDSATRARRSGETAIRVVGTTEKGASASWIFAALQASLLALRTGHIGLRQPAEYVYVVPSVHQFPDER